MRCCLMVYMLKMLSDIAAKPSTIFSFQICPNVKVKLGPTEIFYTTPPSSFDIATARNPNTSVTRIRISVSPRWPWNSLFPFCNILVSPKWAIGHTEFAWPTLFLLFAEIGLTEFMQSASPRWSFALTLAHRSHWVVPVSPTEISNVHILNWIGLTEFFYSVWPSWVKCV